MSKSPSDRYYIKSYRLRAHERQVEVATDMALALMTASKRLSGAWDMVAITIGGGAPVAVLMNRTSSRREISDLMCWLCADMVAEVIRQHTEWMAMFRSEVGPLLAGMDTAEARHALTLIG